MARPNYDMINILPDHLKTYYKIPVIVNAVHRTGKDNTFVSANAETTGKKDKARKFTESKNRTIPIKIIIDNGSPVTQMQQMFILLNH